MGELVLWTLYGTNGLIVSTTVIIRHFRAYPAPAIIIVYVVFLVDEDELIVLLCGCGVYGIEQLHIPGYIATWTIRSESIHHIHIRDIAPSRAISSFQFIHLVSSMEQAKKFQL